MICVCVCVLACVCACVPLHWLLPAPSPVLPTLIPSPTPRLHCTDADAVESLQAHCPWGLQAGAGMGGTRARFSAHRLFSAATLGNLAVLWGACAPLCRSWSHCCCCCCCCCCCYPYPLLRSAACAVRMQAKGGLVLQCCVVLDSTAGGCLSRHSMASFSTAWLASACPGTAKHARRKAGQSFRLALLKEPVPTYDTCLYPWTWTPPQNPLQGRTSATPACLPPFPTVASL